MLTTPLSQSLPPQSRSQRIWFLTNLGLRVRVKLNVTPALYASIRLRSSSQHLYSKSPNRLLFCVPILITTCLCARCLLYLLSQVQKSASYSSLPLWLTSWGQRDLCADSSKGVGRWQAMEKVEGSRVSEWSASGWRMRIFSWKESQIALMTNCIFDLGDVGIFQIRMWPGLELPLRKKNKGCPAIEDSLPLIAAYLEEQDHRSLKETCRAFYYWFVTSDIWMGLKIGVADEKLGDYEDVEFEDSEPKPITKKDKNIRIHSLKKQSENKRPLRQSSQAKPKSKLPSPNTELLFRHTEIGFKRLLKTNNSQRARLGVDTLSAASLYEIGDPQEYTIKSNDAWSTNMKKAQRLLSLVKKFNQFHHRLMTHLKGGCKEMSELLSRLKENEQQLKEYERNTTRQPLASVLQSTEGANQNLLIDEQLNKTGRLFWVNHPLVLASAHEFDSFLEFCSNEKKRLEGRVKSEANSIEFLESINGIEESISSCVGVCEKHTALAGILCPALISIYFQELEKHQTVSICFDESPPFELKSLSWKDLVAHSFFFDTLFQILNSLVTKLLKLAATYCSQELTLTVMVGKLKNLRAVTVSLSNISKYFGKLRKQLEEKKSKAKSELIREFLDEYSGRSGQVLMQTKNPAKLEKWVAEMKEKISTLKGKIQSQ